MKTALICWLGILPALGYAQNTGSCANVFQTVVTPSTDLSMSLRSGDITIAGTDGKSLRVTCSMHDRQNPSDTHITFAANHLTVRGGDHNGVTIRIEIPRSMNLRIRCSAGNITLAGITGNKDIDLNAGNLDVELGKPTDYRDVDASVLAGNISAPAFASERNGLFRKFHHENQAGSYRLRAALLAGNITFH